MMKGRGEWGILIILIFQRYWEYFTILINRNRECVKIIMTVAIFLSPLSLSLSCFKGYKSFQWVICENLYCHKKWRIRILHRLDNPIARWLLVNASQCFYLNNIHKKITYHYLKSQVNGNERSRFTDLTLISSIQTFRINSEM